jgi:mannose-6-phosphate isomerase
LARTVLLDGSTVSVRDLMEQQTGYMLGERHLQRYGKSPALLLKYLDVASHIPVHCHPTREFARKHLDSFFGKTEAWLILGARAMGATPARVWIGWREEVKRDRLMSWIEVQNIKAMRAAMHEVDVRVDDVLFVPAGTAHSLGEGVFALEPQEPTDFAAFAEHATYGLSDDIATNGLGWEVAVDMFDLSVLDDTDLEKRIKCEASVQRSEPGGLDRRLIPEEAEAFFRLNEITVRDRFPDSGDGAYVILSIRAGAGAVRGTWGEVFVRKGETYLIPAGLKDYEFECQTRAPMRVLRVQPPL